MSEFHLLQGQTTTTAPPSTAAQPPLIAIPQPSGGNAPTGQQTFQVRLQGVGSCSATIQVYASNDFDPFTDGHWTTYGAPQAISGFGDLLPLPMASWSGSQAFRAFCAIVTAINGTQAAVYLKMNA